LFFSGEQGLVDPGLLIEAMRLFGGGDLAHPAYLIFFVTGKCTGRCRHCFYWESLNKPENPLTLSEIEKVSSSMGRLLQVTFTGGEPTLRDDLAAIIETMHRINRVYHIGVATNGYYPERVESVAREVLLKCAGAKLTVGLPIEGPPELNDDIRGREDFYRRTVESIEVLKSMKKTSPNLTVLVDVTASGFNRGRLRETYELVRDRICPDEINLILTRGVPREEGAKDIDPKEIASVLSLMEDDIRAGRLPGYGFFAKLMHAKDVVLRRQALDILERETYHQRCEAGRAAGVLLPEGELYACELWQEPMGNVRGSNYSVPELWTSERAKNIRAEIKDTRCSCFHQCFLSNSIFWNLKSWPSIIREWARIEAGR